MTSGTQSIWRQAEIGLGQIGLLSIVRIEKRTQHVSQCERLPAVPPTAPSQRRDTANRIHDNCNLRPAAWVFITDASLPATAAGANRFLGERWHS